MAATFIIDAQKDLTNCFHFERFALILFLALRLSSTIHSLNMPAPTQLLQDGRYRVGNQIPLNGQTAIYEAYDTVRNVNVVVKEIVVHLNKVMTAAQQEQMRSTFAEQARVLTDVNHASLLQVVDYFSEIGRQYLVLEYVDGECLADVVESGGASFASADVVNWGDQLLDAISYLHNHTPAVIHGSIRPQNIKLTGDGRIKLLDVGLPDASGNKLSTSIFVQGVGTEISYSPLEQIWSSLDSASQKVIANGFDESHSRALNEPLGPRSDIYALAATLYHLLTGRKPVDALERAIDLLDGKADPLKPANELAPAVQPEISDVVMKGMSLMISDRFESASIMRQILKTAVVRAKEREDDEESEDQDAAEVLRNATPRVPVSTMNFKRAAGYEPVEPGALAPTQTTLPAAVGNAVQTEFLERKLREAEELRSQAEKRAADAERLLREKEAAMARETSPAPPIAAVLESDLLEIPLGPADIPSLPPVRQAAPVEKHSAPITAEPDFVYESADIGPAKHVSADSTPSFVQDSENDFALGGDYSTASRRSLPMSAIAGGGALLGVLLVIGGWFLLGSSNTSAPVQTQTAATADLPTEVPAGIEPTMSVQEVAPEQANGTAPEVPATDTGVSEPTASQTSAATVRTARKAAPEPQKKPVKKAVTVDDLISDN